MEKMWSLKSLAMFKREGRTSLHAVQYKWQAATYYFKNGSSRHLVLMFV